MVSKIRKYVVGALTGLALLASVGCGSRINKDDKIAHLQDLNNDGKQDVLLMTSEGKYEKVFINTGNGSYVECNVLIDNGIPFYRTLDGKVTYDPWNGQLGKIR